jgi:hypothetical protein
MSGCSWNPTAAIVPATHHPASTLKLVHGRGSRIVCSQAQGAKLLKNKRN